MLERVDTGAEPLLRLRPRSFDDVRAALAGEGPGRPTPYWASAWPSGYALIRAVASSGRRDGQRVLELGCGPGMPAVAAARAGATVLAADVAPEAVVYGCREFLAMARPAWSLRSRPGGVDPEVTVHRLARRPRPSAGGRVT